MPTDPIEHVIVLMLENRSFDHMLGAFQQVYPTLAGIPPGDSPRFDLYTKTQKIYRQLPNKERQLDPSPLHEHRDVMLQISGGMSGFIDDYATVPGSKEDDYPAVMGYYPMDFLPVLHTLAKNFTICDHWFSSLPGPTWPNRFFVHSATCNGHVSMPDGFYHPDIPALHQPQQTIYNRLQDKGISWGIFHHGLSQALLLERLWDHPLHFHPIQRFYDMCKTPDNPDGRLPQYCFLEPAFRGPDENDQHPPADVMNGEILIANVYNAIRNSDAWNKSLLVVTYDEHGGFYDHLEPPAAVPPDAHTDEFSFTQYGPRVPALLISPRAPKNVVNTVFDHTSILRYLSEKWDLPPLTERARTANSIGTVLDFTGPLLGGSPQTVTAAIAAPVPVRSNTPSVTNHEQGLLSFARYLDATMNHKGEAAIAAYVRLQREYEHGLEEKIDVAKERFALFLKGTITHLKGTTTDGSAGDTKSIPKTPPHV
jgi:phospholipase C